MNGEAAMDVNGSGAASLRSNMCAETVSGSERELFYDTCSALQGKCSTGRKIAYETKSV